ncbi:uncharacterized protein SCHCODRAFT_02667996 [Schizophyllum commune H4-8]|nr:uncharacterized protein SCHCODRAFT_02667996 [Schizophyllum commune H4-8]KAI5892558.1 hypothetical protein SCHCODRAFT_02667996 [Schizophyllum commune H4-8]
MTFLSGVYTITNVGTGTALHLDGHPVQGWEKLSGADRLKQLWFLRPTDTSDSGNSDDAKWVALNIARNKCLDVDSSNSANGTEIIGYPYHKTDNQHWIIRHPASSSYWRFQSVETNTFIDLKKGQSGNGTKKSFTGRQIQAVHYKNGKLKGKVIVEYPDRMCVGFPPSAVTADRVGMLRAAPEQTRIRVCDLIEVDLFAPKAPARSVVDVE